MISRFVLSTELKIMENVNKTLFDPDEVQLCKPFSAVNNRIDNFCKRKREEINDKNTRLYCNSVTVNDCGSSRTSTTVTTKCQKGTEFYVKKVKVQNISGPQCNGGLDPASTNSYKFSNNTNSCEPNFDVNERISNIEKCLDIQKNDCNKIDIYNRLKSIEDHVLKLENILLNINENYSLSNLCSKDLQTSILNSNLKDKDFTQVNIKINHTHDKVTDEDIKSTLPCTLPKKSKYSADEIQDLINNIKKE